MTAESISSFESNDNVRKLQIVKASNELSSRAVPPVLEWGPSELEDTKPSSSKPLSYSDGFFEQTPDDN